jgi:hypothetical protein
VLVLDGGLGRAHLCVVTLDKEACSFYRGCEVIAGGGTRWNDGGRVGFLGRSRPGTGWVPYRAPELTAGRPPDRSSFIRYASAATTGTARTPMIGERRNPVLPLP